MDVPSGDFLGRSLRAMPLFSRSLSFTPTTVTLLSVLLVYPFIQRHLRFKREREMLKKYGYTKREDLKRMDMDTASEIQRYMAEWEFPDAFLQSLSLGFVQTLAFPDAAKILHGTNEISSSHNSPKRFFDTSLLYSELVSFPPSSQRTRTALARINYLHSNYKTITNDQYLYVLGVFAVSPWAFIERWEWRAMNDMETGAMGVFWAGIGEMMKIDMGEVKGAGKNHPRYSKTERVDVEQTDKDNGAAGGDSIATSTNQLWDDPIDWMLDMQAWCREYEEKGLEYNDQVGDLVRQSGFAGLTLWPTMFLKLLRGAWSLVRFESRYRKAIGAGDLPWFIQLPGNAWYALVKFYLLHISLPRFTSARNIPSDPDPVTGRYNTTEYMTHPYYVKNTWWNRWGPDALTRRVLGGPVPGMEGERYRPEGYKVEDIGPEKYEGKGHEWMREDVKEGERIMPKGRCPFGMMQAS